MNHLFSWRQGRALLGVAAFAIGCSGTSSSETNATAGSGGGTSSSSSTSGGGNTSSTTGSSTTATTGGSGVTTGGGATGGGGGTSGGGGGATSGGGVATGGVAGMTGAGGSTGGSGTGSCPAQTNFTLAVHVIVDVTWPASTATNAGSGKLHLWNRAVLSASGLSLSGDTTPCGTMLPEFGLNGAGQIVTGGSKVLIEVPNMVWDAPTIPKLTSKGTISGWNAGSTIAFEPTVALVGLTMADPMAMWPASFTGITAVDVDGDTKAGFTAAPRNGTGYVLPPTGLGIFGSAPSADKIYLASRTVVTLAGKFDSCEQQSGMATVPLFDSHVVGCHINNGGECTNNGANSQTDFVDTSRTIYKPGAATFTSKHIPDGASCADVRAALP
jgi:hypothetical protein